MDFYVTGKSGKSMEGVHMELFPIQALISEALRLRLFPLGPQTFVRGLNMLKELRPQAKRPFEICAYLKCWISYIPL